MNNYSDYEYNALGHLLRQQMFGVELNEDEQILASMATLKFLEIEIPKVENELQRIKIQDKWGFISKDGWIVFPVYSGAWIFQEGFALVQRADGKMNHINTKGELLSEEWWAWVGHFKKGFALVQRADGKMNHINTKGKPISEEWWDTAWYFSEGFAKVRRAYGKMNHIDTNGKTISEEWRYEVYHFDKGFAWVMRADGTKGYIDTKGNFYDKLPK